MKLLAIMLLMFAGFIYAEQSDQAPDHLDLTEEQQWFRIIWERSRYDTHQLRRFTVPAYPGVIRRTAMPAPDVAERP